MNEKKHFRLMLPLTSYLEVAPGSKCLVSMWSRFAAIVEQTVIHPSSLGSFEVLRVALCSARGSRWPVEGALPPRGSYLPLLVAEPPCRIKLSSISAALNEVVIPACVELQLVIHNTGNFPRMFHAGAGGYHSPLEVYADGRSAGLSEERCRDLEAALLVTSEGQKRRDFRDAAVWLEAIHGGA